MNERWNKIYKATLVLCALLPIALIGGCATVPDVENAACGNQNQSFIERVIRDQVTPAEVKRTCQIAGSV